MYATLVPDALVAVWYSAGFATGRLRVRISAWSTSHQGLLSLPSLRGRSAAGKAKAGMAHCGREKFAVFGGNRRLSPKQYETPTGFRNFHFASDLGALCSCRVWQTAIEFGSMRQRCAINGSGTPHVKGDGPQRSQILRTQRTVIRIYPERPKSTKPTRPCEQPRPSIQSRGHLSVCLSVYLITRQINNKVSYRT